VGIGNREWTTVGIVGVIGGHMSERIGDRLELTALGSSGAGIVGIGGEVGDIGPRAIEAEHPTIVIVGVGPGTASTSCRVVEGLLKEVPRAVVPERCRPKRCT